MNSGQSRKAAGEYCSKQDVRVSLSALIPHLAAYWTRPLREYATAAYDVDPFHSQVPERQRAMERLARCIERAALRSGFESEEARRASLQMLAAPVLQTGPHCLLLVEPDAYYTHVFSLLGLIAHSREWHIAYNTSTVSFSEKAKRGPGWIWLEDEPLNVFGLSRRRMDSSSLCGLDGPFRFALSNAKGNAAPNNSAVRLLGELPAHQFSSATEAIRTANQTLWRRSFPSPLKLLQLDDFDICDLVADHLEDEMSWMSTGFIADPGVAKSILKAIDHMNSGPWKGWIRRTTDLFWGLEKGRIVPMQLCDGALDAKTPSRLKVSFRPDQIAGALRQRTIVPSLYTAFLVLSILPGVRVLGGCRQVIYYPLMRHLTALGLQHSDHRSLLETLMEDKQSGWWGHRVLKPDGGYPFQEMENSRDIAAVQSSYGEMPLMQSCGDLASFTTDPVWAELSKNIASGTLIRKSEGWRCAG